jgi:hypothetical protein
MKPPNCGVLSEEARGRETLNRVRKSRDISVGETDHPRSLGNSSDVIDIKN